MKHKKYTCDSCGCETSKARPVDGYILCNPCHHELIKPKKDWFERQRIIKEENAMNGFDAILGNPAY